MEDDATPNPPLKTSAKSVMVAIDVIQNYLEECEVSQHVQSELDAGYLSDFGDRAWPLLRRNAGFGEK